MADATANVIAALQQADYEARLRGRMAMMHDVARRVAALECRIATSGQVKGFRSVWGKFSMSDKESVVREHVLLTYEWPDDSPIRKPVLVKHPIPEWRDALDAHLAALETWAAAVMEAGR